MEKRITILLADGNEDFARQLKTAISGAEAYEVIGIAADRSLMCSFWISCLPSSTA